MFDTVIINGEIMDPVDGRFQANIGIKDRLITSVSPELLQGKKVINAESKIVSPGFIDIHMHEDELVNGDIEFEIFNYMVLMGVTTAVGGNCGLGKANIKKYFDILREKGSPVNYIGLIGHSSLREMAGCQDRYSPATAEQIEEMSKMLRKGLEAGAAGLSFGLEYNPGTSCRELFKLSELVAEFPGRLVAAHYRFDAVRSLEALAEMIIIARETGVKFQVSHIGSCTAFGVMKEGLVMLEAAYEAGVDIMADVYPYDAFSTKIGSAVFDEGCFERWGASYQDIEVAEGRFRGRRCDQEIFEYIRKNEADDLVIAFVMNEDEVITALQHPLVMIGSDGLLNKGQGHPRAAGTFPRVLGKYVREEKVLDLQTAIKKMTYLPAQRLGLSSKGRVKEGFDADITIFAENKIIDRATFQEPTLKPDGISNVIIAGQEVVSAGVITDNNAGIVILM